MRKGIILTLTLVFTALTILFVFGRCRDAGKRDEKRERAIDSVAAVVVVQTAAVDTAAQVQTDAIAEYRRWLSTATVAQAPVRRPAQPTSTIPIPRDDSFRTTTPAVDACIQNANAVVSACEVRTLRATELERSLRTEINLLSQRQKFAVPRFRAYAEGGYDFIHASPRVAVGAELRIYRSVSAVADVGVLTAGQGREAWRAGIGLRINLR